MALILIHFILNLLVYLFFAFGYYLRAFFSVFFLMQRTCSAFNIFCFLLDTGFYLFYFF